MKKNSPLRLKLHRETLGSLTSSGLAAARGGNNSAVNNCTITLYVTCVCPPLTHTCPTICGLQCSATTTAC